MASYRRLAVFTVPWACRTDIHGAAVQQQLPPIRSLLYVRGRCIPDTEDATSTAPLDSVADSRDCDRSSVPIPGESGVDPLVQELDFMSRAWRECAILRANLRAMAHSAESPHCEVFLRHLSDPFFLHLARI